jgi:DNA-binding NarL/FixJ family response regulator
MPPEKQIFTGVVVVAIANPIVRRALGDAFRQRGAEELAEVSDYEVLRQVLKSSVVDMLVADDNLSELFVGELVRDIRRGELHEHPFPLVIMLAHRQEEKDLRALMDCGPDAIVLTPVSVAELARKIDSLAAGRKQFVITRDYIGPDRRSAPRAGAAPALTLEAPNPLGAGVDRGAFHAALDRAKSDLKVKRTECTLGQLAWAMKSGNSSDLAEMVPLVEHLAETAPNPKFKAAANGLAGAMRDEDKKAIMGWCSKLLAASKT